jgi:putative ABC transport system permease protein
MLYRYVIRNIKKRLFLNLIKVAGLALGLSGILFISLFLKNELSYDAYHQNADRIYRFTHTDPNSFGNAHFARIYDSDQVSALAEYFPEIENYVRLAPVRGGVIMFNDRFYSLNEGFICDSTFFNVFDAELVIGDKQTILNYPASVVVSESFSKRVFGNESPIGKTISIPPGQFYGERIDYTVKGIMNDFPQNSHFHPDLITTINKGEMNGWAWVYLKLTANTDPDKIEKGFAGFLSQRNNQPIDKITTKAYLQKLTDIHLHSDKLREIESNGNITNIYVLFIAALILLLISTSNFASMNLGLAGFTKKFIAINQTLGSSKHLNLRYFLFESSLIVSVSIVLTMLISIPVNTFIKNQFEIDLFEGNTALIVLVTSLFGLLGMFAGLQPVLKQRIERINAKANRTPSGNSIFVSKWILITQYSFAIILIASVLIITRQNQYVLSNSMGVKENNVLCFESVHADIQQKFGLFKSELLKLNTIESVSAMLDPPGGEANDAFPFEMEGFQKQDDKQTNLIGVFPCDYSFADLFHLRFLGGNNFSMKNLDVEGSGEYIINKTAMHYLNFSTPNEVIGKSFKLNSPSQGIDIPRGKIIGVVDDFYLSTMKKKVGPLVMFKRDKLWLINFVISYKSGMREAAIADIQKVWQDMFPAYPFNYEHVGSLYRKVYKTELLQAKLLTIFTFISLFICSMGLLGLTLLVTQQRIKEIGIRKVNGAKISEVMALLNKDLVKWVAFAIVIAMPIAYYAMHKWLENFAYKTELSWWIFALAGLLAMGIALLTVSWQSWRAATRNPVDALRYE